MLNRIKAGIAAHVPIEHADIPQPDGGVVLFQLLDRGAPRRVVIDTDDRLVLNDSANEADVYFKMQYLRGGYGSPHIRPGGYVCLQPALYRYRWNWRKLRRRTSPIARRKHGHLGIRRWKAGRPGRCYLPPAGPGPVWLRSEALAPYGGAEYIDEMCNAARLPGTSRGAGTSAIALLSTSP